MSFTATTMTTDAEINQSRSVSPLERLPGEIRNKIYDLVLHNNESPNNDSCITISPTLTLNPRPGLGYDPACFALLFVNKLIHREASTFLYAVNTFCFMVPPAMLSLLPTKHSCYIRDFFKSIGPAVKYIGKIQLEAEMEDFNLVFCEPFLLPLVRTTVSWEDLVRYLDKELPLTSFDMTIRMPSFDDPCLEGKMPEFPLHQLNQKLVEIQSHFSNHFRARKFRCSTTLAPNNGWTSDMSAEEMETIASELKLLKLREQPGMWFEKSIGRSAFYVKCHLS